MNEISTKSQAKYMFYMSNLTFLTFIYNYYIGYHKTSMGSFCIWITSLLYWNNPQYGWRRTLDIGTVNTVLAINLWIARNAQYRIPFYINMVLCGICFSLGIYYNKKNNLWLGMFWHSGVHVFGNLGNVFLYSGAIDVKEEPYTTLAPEGTDPTGVQS